jgi:hypothetical protein
MNDEQPPSETNGVGGDSVEPDGDLHRSHRQPRGRAWLRRLILIARLLLLAFGALTTWQAWNA